MRVEFWSYTARLWIEITCKPKITTWEQDVYPQTARVFPLGTISWQSSLNPHARNQRSVQPRCCYVRFFERFTKQHMVSVSQEILWNFCSIETVFLYIPHDIKAQNWWNIWHFRDKRLYVVVIQLVIQICCSFEMDVLELIQLLLHLSRHAKLYCLIQAMKRTIHRSMCSFRNTLILSQRRYMH